jgi:HlyD family secretion protein
MSDPTTDATQQLDAVPQEPSAPTTPRAGARKRRRKDMKWGYIVVAVVIVLLAAFLVYKAIGPKKSSTTYVTQPVAQGTLTVAVSGNGNVISANSASVNPQVSGTVMKLGVSLGTYVKKGDTLFVLDNASLDAQVVSARASYQQAQASTSKALQSQTQAQVGKQTSVLQAKASMQQAQASVINAKIAYEKAAATAKATPTEANEKERAAANRDLAAAKTSLKDATVTYKHACTIAQQGYSAATKSYAAAVTAQDSSYLDYQQAKTNAGMRTVTAPISGYITTLSVNNGDQVSGNSSNASTSRSSNSGATSSGTSTSITSPIVITNLGNLKAQVQIAETDRPNVKTGQKADLTFSAVPDLTITGKVAEIDAVGTSSSGVVTYNVTITFDVQDKRLTPGMSVAASIITATYTNVLLVPNAAVKTDTTGATYVQVLANPNGTPQDVPVTTGAAGESQTIISQGVQAGQNVVTQTISAGSGSSTASRSGLSVLGGARAGGGGGFGGGRPGQ